METKEILKEINKDFYSLRNGIIVDSLRKIYPVGTKIFGLNVPQFMELARKYSKELNLGLELWKDKDCRESRLLSLYIIPPAELKKEIAKEMVKEVKSVEEAEFLAFRILRNLPYAKELLEELTQEEISESLPAYCIAMFKKNLDQI